MGIEPASVNVSDLRITRPDRSGPGGDVVGTPAVLGSDLDACLDPEERIFRRRDGREVASFGRFYIDPVYDDVGELVPIVPGDLVEYTDAFGQAVDPQEIVSVAPTMDCDGDLDIVSFRIGRATGA